MNGQTQAKWNNPTDINASLPVESQPILTEFTERFNKELQRQSESIQRIQNKLHNILDKTMPEKDPTAPEPNLDDTASKLRYLQGKLETNSMMLERIFNHLSAIV